MQFIHLRNESSPAPLSDGRMLDALAGLIACVGSQDFGTAALAQLNRGLPLCWWSMYSLHADAPPTYHGGGSFGVPDRSEQAFNAYRDGLYRGDHTFEEARETLQPDEVGLTHWRADEIAAPHRSAIYTRNRLQERTSLVRRTQPGVLLALNLYRHVEQPPFRDRELQALELMSRPLLSCIELHLRRPGPTADAAVHGPGSRVAQALSRADGDNSPQRAAAERWAARAATLPRREREVCERLLKGWTHAGIAADLGLSAGTVKTYRDRAFDRLGIHHRSQLFALALDTLG